MKRRVRGTKRASGGFAKRMKAATKEIRSYSWGHIVTLVVGILSFVSLLVILFLPLSKGPSQFSYTSAMPAVSNPQFIRSLSNSLNLPVDQGETVQTLSNGDAFLDAFLRDIDGARRSINIMVYIWTDGRMSDQVIEHLSRKIGEGVEVRIMIDSFGSNWWERPSKLKSLKSAGAKVEVFRSLTIAPWDFLKNHLRNHRRAMIVDGETGYLGGMAISDPWLGDARNSKETRDLMFRVTGSMARHLQGVFSELWASTAGEILVGDRFYTPQQEAKDKRSLTYISLPSTPTPDTLVLQKFVLLSLAAAEKKIYITSPYFLPDLSLREILIRKAKEGVDVRVLVPNDLNDSRAVRHASRDSYDELLAGGVHIYEYQPAFIHAKSLVVDSSWSIVGSANMDNRSRKLNEEAVLGILDRELGMNLEAIFLADAAKAEEIKLREWRNRGLWPRVQELVSRNFIEQY